MNFKESREKFKEDQSKEGRQIYCPIYYLDPSKDLSRSAERARVEKKDSAPKEVGEKFCPIYPLTGATVIKTRTEELREQTRDFVASDIYDDWTKSESNSAPLISEDQRTTNYSASEVVEYPLVSGQYGVELYQQPENGAYSGDVMDSHQVQNERMRSGFSLVQNNYNLNVSEKSKEGDLGLLTNYTIRPLLMRRIVDHTGEIVLNRCTVKSELMIRQADCTVRQELDVLWTEIEKLAHIIQARFPHAIAYKKSAYAQVEIIFREQLNGVPEKICFAEHGWHFLNGKHFYVHRSAKNIPGEICTTLNLPSYDVLQLRECFEIWERSMCLYGDSGIMAAISACSFLGVSYKLFEEALFEPNRACAR